MFDKNYTIFLLVCVGLAVVAYMCLEQGALWGSVIAGIVSVLVVLFAIFRWAKRKCQLQGFLKFIMSKIQMRLVIHVSSKHLMTSKTSEAHMMI